MLVFTVDEIMNDFDDYKTPVTSDAEGARYSSGSLEYALAIGERVAVVLEREVRKSDDWWVGLLSAEDVLVAANTPEEAWKVAFDRLGLPWPRDHRGDLHYNVARHTLPDHGYGLGCTAKLLGRKPVWEEMS